MNLVPAPFPQKSVRAKYRRAYCSAVDKNYVTKEVLREVVSDFLFLKSAFFAH